MFSGPTRYFSLAVAAFFGIGAYVVAICIKDHAALWLLRARGRRRCRWWRSLVGLDHAAGLRHPFFVIFTFGLSELIRELAIWWEINQTKTVGRYVF